MVGEIVRTAQCQPEWENKKTNNKRTMFDERGKKTASKTPNLFDAHFYSSFNNKYYLFSSILIIEIKIYLCRILPNFHNGAWWQPPVAGGGGGGAGRSRRFGPSGAWRGPAWPWV
jgi:hypothetical protein